jgi:hypothetical protein
MIYEDQGLFLHGRARMEHTFEAPLKHMTRTRPVTERVRHFEKLCIT